ncbi:MAG: DUF4397 domain-containing protein [Oscillochloris sp.]|nr:DUF4397 domain-containing protein [Oscillochloris sp.]
MFRRQLLTAVAMIALMIGGTAAFSVQAAQSSQPTGSPLAQATANVAIAHLAPFSNTDTTATIVIDGNPLPQTLEYKETLAYQPFPAGDYEVQVFAGTDTSGSPAISETLTLAAGMNYTVVAAGDGTDIPLQFIVLEDDNSAPAAGQFSARIVHAAPFAEQANTAVDILGDPGNVNLNLNNISFGAASPNLSLPAGGLDVVVVNTGTTTPVFNPDAVNITAGTVATIFAIGGANNALAELFIFDRTPEPTQELPPLNARVAIAHLAPFSDESTAVTVVIDNVPLPGTLSYKDSLPYTSLPPGDYSVQIYAGATTTGTPVISETVTFAAGMDYTVAAVGDDPDPSDLEGNIPVQLLQLTDDNTAPASTSVSFRVVHAAPFAPAGDTEVDVLAQVDAITVPLVLDVAFGDSSTYQQTPPGTVDALVVDSDDPSTEIFDPDPLTLTGGTITTIFAIGGANGFDPELFTLAGSPRAMAKIRAAHLAPFAPGNATVSVYAGPVGGETEPLIETLNYGQITDYLEVPEGQYLIEIVLPAAPNALAQTVVASTTVTLQAGAEYTAVAFGSTPPQVNQAQPVELEVLGSLAPVPGQGRIRAVHAVPIAAAATVDVRLQDDTVVFNDLPYKGDVNTTVEPGFVDLKITTPDGATTLLDPDPIYVGAGEVVTVFVIGDGENQDLMVLTSGGGEPFKLYLPLIFNGEEA